MQLGIFIACIVIAATLVSIAKHLNEQNKIQTELVNKMEEILQAMSKDNGQN